MIQTWIRNGGCHKILVEVRKMSDQRPNFNENVFEIDEQQLTVNEQQHRLNAKYV